MRRFRWWQKFRIYELERLVASPYVAATVGITHVRHSVTMLTLEKELQDM